MLNLEQEIAEIKALPECNQYCELAGNLVNVYKNGLIPEILENYLKLLNGLSGMINNSDIMDSNTAYPDYDYGYNKARNIILGKLEELL